VAYLSPLHRATALAAIASVSQPSSYTVCVTGAAAIVITRRSPFRIASCSTLLIVATPRPWNVGTPRAGITVLAVECHWLRTRKLTPWQAKGFTL
jgi:hypothetical protein